MPICDAKSQRISWCLDHISSMLVKFHLEVDFKINCMLGSI